MVQDGILEEVAAFAVMFKETRAVDVYPGAWFKEVFEAIAQAPEASERMSGFTNTACLRVDFTRNNGYSFKKDDLPMFNVSSDKLS